MSLRRWKAALTASVVALVVSAGCTVDALYHGDLPFPFWLPVPVAPWMGDMVADWKTKDYSQVPIMPPIRDYAPVFCMDPPSDYDVIRAMKKPTGKIPNIPYLHEKHYNNMQIFPEKLVDSIDECRFYPLVGPAQLHHCHYKVTVYYDVLRHSYYPFSWEVKYKDVEVLYIDKDHLHICTSAEMEEIPESYKDIYGTY
jgi:hypothetical protein